MFRRYERPTVALRGASVLMTVSGRSLGPKLVQLHEWSETLESGDTSYLYEFERTLSEAIDELERIKTFAQRTEHGDITTFKEFLRAASHLHILAMLPESTSTRIRRTIENTIKRMNREMRQEIRRERFASRGRIPLNERVRRAFRSNVGLVRDEIESGRTLRDLDQEKSNAHEQLVGALKQVSERNGKLTKEQQGSLAQAINAYIEDLERRLTTETNALKNAEMIEADLIHELTQLKAHLKGEPEKRISGLKNRLSSILRRDARISRQMRRQDLIKWVEERGHESQVHDERLPYLRKHGWRRGEKNPATQYLLEHWDDFTIPALRTITALAEDEETTYSAFEILKAFVYSTDTTPEQALNLMRVLSKTEHVKTSKLVNDLSKHERVCRALARCPDSLITLIDLHRLNLANWHRQQLFWELCTNASVQGIPFNSEAFIRECMQKLHLEREIDRYAEGPQLTEVFLNRPILKAIIIDIYESETVPRDHRFWSRVEWTLGILTEHDKTQIEHIRPHAFAVTFFSALLKIARDMHASRKEYMRFVLNAAQELQHRENVTKSLEEFITLACRLDTVSLVEVFGAYENHHHRLGDQLVELLIAYMKRYTDAAESTQIELRNAHCLTHLLDSTGLVVDKRDVSLLKELIRTRQLLMLLTIRYAEELDGLERPLHRNLSNIELVRSRYEELNLERHYGLDKKGMKAVLALALTRKVGPHAIDGLVIPITRVQDEGWEGCLRAISDIASTKGMIAGMDDMKTILQIQRYRKLRTEQFLRDIVIEGTSRGTIKPPLRSNEEALLTFLKESPIDDHGFYADFVRFIEQGGAEEDKAGYFKKLNRIKEQIVTGSVDPDIDELMLLGILRHSFPPELSVHPTEYNHIFQHSADRTNDIPEAFRNHAPLRITVLQSETKSNTSDPTELKRIMGIVEAHDQHHRTLDIAEAGIELISSYRNIEKTESLIGMLYDQWRALDSQSLQTGSLSPGVLDQYEYVFGTRIRYHVIPSMIDAALKERPDLAIDTDTSGLVRSIRGILSSNISESRKLEALNSLLTRNSLEPVGELPSSDPEAIRAWMGEIARPTRRMSESIYSTLLGESHHKIQTHARSFKRSKRWGRTLPLRFVLSKSKVHVFARLNAGVCIYENEEAWNDPLFWQLVIFDDTDTACGCVLYQTIIDEGKRYLITSIHPNSQVLSRVDIGSITTSLIKASRVIGKRLNYHGVLVPVAHKVLSNRPSICAEVEKRSYPTITLSKSRTFYGEDEYQECYVVG
jgi:hypothetical protein